MVKGKGKRIVCPECGGAAYTWRKRGRLVRLSTVGKIFHKTKHITMTRDSPEPCHVCKGKGWVYEGK